MDACERKPEESSGEWKKRDAEKERRVECENVEEIVEDGRGRKKEGENYGGLLLCKHRSRELSSCRHMSTAAAELTYNSSSLRIGGTIETVHSRNYHGTPNR